MQSTDRRDRLSPTCLLLERVAARFVHQLTPVLQAATSPISRGMGRHRTTTRQNRAGAFRSCASASLWGGNRRRLADDPCTLVAFVV